MCTWHTRLSTSFAFGLKSTSHRALNLNTTLSRTITFQLELPASKHALGYHIPFQEFFQQFLHCCSIFCSRLMMPRVVVVMLLVVWWHY